MTIFNDGDLRNLKKHGLNCLPDKGRGVIERLETAEAICERARTAGIFPKDVQAWLRAAGRPPISMKEAA